MWLTKIMIQNLTYSKKVYLILGVSMLCLIIAYKVAFSKTITLFRDTKTKTEKLEWLKEKEKDIPYLQTQMALLDKAYNSGDSSSIRDQLTAFISDFAERNDAMVTEIPEKSFYSKTNLNVQTNKFIIKGNFKNLVLLLNAVEKQYTYTAKVVSAKFYSIKDLQTKKTNLYMALITQSFKQENKITTNS